MQEHLVMNHLYGNYYVSNGEISDIEEYCEQCGDCDQVLASWDDEKVEEGIKAILPCCYMAAYINSDSESEEENFQAWVSESGYEVIDFDIQKDVIKAFSDATKVVNYLEENKEINFYVASRLRGEISLRQGLWMQLAQKFIFSKIVVKENSLVKSL